MLSVTPRISSVFNASRMEVRLAQYLRASSRSGGSLSPGLRVPFRISDLIRSTMDSYVFFEVSVLSALSMLLSYHRKAVTTEVLFFKQKLVFKRAQPEMCRMRPCIKTRNKDCCGIELCCCVEACCGNELCCYVEA